MKHTTDPLSAKEIRDALGVTDEDLEAARRAIGGTMSGELNFDACVRRLRACVDGDDGSSMALEFVLSRLASLQAEVLAHKENEGDECPLCVCEAEKNEAHEAIESWISKYTADTKALARIIDAGIESNVKLQAEVARLKGYLQETREMLVWDSDDSDYERIIELRDIVDDLLSKEGEP